MSGLRDQILRVRNEFGAVTPQTVLTAATPEEHPLHDRFEWDDHVAGHQYRLVQARELIRSVRVVYAEDKRGPKDVRAFIAVRPDEMTPDREYVPTEEVMADSFTRQLVLRELERELASLKRKYGHLKEFGELLKITAEEVA